MRCPNCDSENSDSAKFCKKCGTALEKKSISHKNIINSMNDKKTERDNTTKYIIVALVIITVVLAGTLAYIYGFGQNLSDDTQVQPDENNQSVNESEEPAQAQTQQTTQATSAMSILGGSFSTGGGLSDKTYASINVGSEHAGENVNIQIFYSRDGSDLNNGNMVPKTVNSEGYIDVASAEAYKYYPDFAEINLYDASGNLLDTQSVSLNPESGTQTF